MARMSTETVGKGVMEMLRDKSLPKKVNLRCEKLSDKVVEFIIDNISNATFTPGQKINPREIARQLGVSIMPVRDALERLDQQGWIVRYPQIGTYVKKIDLGEMAEKCQTRSMIESEAVINLVESGSADDFEQLRGLVVENEIAATKQDLVYYEKTDILFHRKLVELGCGEHLMKNHAEIMDRLHYNFFVIVASSETLQKHDFLDINNIEISHKNIFEAIEIKDLVTALRLIRGHINNSIGRFTEILRIRGVIDRTMFEVDSVLEDDFQGEVFSKGQGQNETKKKTFSIS